MAKAHTKAKKQPPKKKPTRAVKKTPFSVAAPPVVTLSELAKLADVSDQTILRCRNEDPNAPGRLGEKYLRDAWLTYLQARALYGPRFWKVMTTEERAAAITGNVTPAAAPAAAPAGAPTPEDLAAVEHASSESTTPAELMKLSPGDLLKSKLAEEILARRLQRLERRRRLIPRAEVEEHIFTHAQSALSFKRQMKLELPPKLVGLDRPEIELKLGEALDELFRRIATLGDPIAAPASMKEPAAPAAVEPAPDAPKQK